MVRRVGIYVEAANLVLELGAAVGVTPTRKANVDLRRRGVNPKVLAGGGVGVLNIILLTLFVDDPLLA